MFKLLDNLPNVVRLKNLVNRWPVLWVELQHAIDEVVHVHTEARLKRLLVVAQDLVDKPHFKRSASFLRLEWVVEVAHLVEHDAEGPDVGLETVRLFQEDLRRHVVVSAHLPHGFSESRLKLLGSAEVCNLDDSVGHSQDIVRLQVTVDDVLFVHVLQTKANLHEPLQDLLLIEEADKA